MGATDPSPSCSVPHGVLCRMASPVELHWLEMAADHVLPAARLMMSGLALSLTVVGPGRWTVSFRLIILIIVCRAELTESNSKVT